MKRLTLALTAAAAALFALPVADAVAWGASGHRTIGVAAMRGLPEDLPAFLRALRGLDTLRVQGLMTLAVLSDDERAVRACFRRLREWRDRLRQDGFEAVSRLSMGMSGDFEIAIEEGATDIRVGSALFGGR